MQVLAPVAVRKQSHSSQKTLATLKTEIRALKEQLRQAEAQQTLLQSAFDAFPIGTVVLAADGTILQANTTWQRFHQEQELLDGSAYIGDNYLDLCDAPVPFVAEAPAAAQGIRAVIAGEQSEFRLDFPWPGRQRWFTVCAVPLAEPAPRRVIITHTDSTVRKSAEAAERTHRSYTEALLRSLTALNSSLDVEAIMKQILTAAAMVVPSEAGSIILFAGEQAQVAYCRGFSAAAAAFFKKQHFCRVDIMPRGDVSHANGYVIPDTKLSANWLPLHYTEWIRSSIGVPITIRGEVIGLLVADSSTPHHFQPVDLEKLQAFAHHAGLALENAQHVQRLETHVQERTTELQTAIEQTNAILDNSLDSILLIQPNLEIKRVNQAFHRLFACSRAQEDGASLLQFIHGDDIAIVTAAIQTVQANGIGQLCEARARRCDGTTFIAEFSLGPLKNTGLVCTIRDITLRKQADIALAEERNLLRTLIDAIPDVIFIKDCEHRVVLRNKAQGVLLPTIPPETLVGKSGADFFPAAEAAVTQAEERHILETGEPILRDERRITRADGSKGWIARTKLPLRNLQGEIIGLAGIIQDISQRKAHEQQLRFYAGMQENVSDAVITADLDFRIQSWNRAAETTYGWRAEEVIGRRLKDVLRTDYPAHITPLAIMQMLLKCGSVTSELLQYRKDATPIYTFCSTTLLKDEQGLPYGIVTINRDVTEQKSANEALRAQRDLLQQVIDGVPAFIMVTDIVGNIQFANQTMAKQVDLTPTQLVGIHATELGHQAQDLPSLQQLWYQALNTGEAVQQEKRILGRLYEVAMIPLKNQQAQYDRVLVVATDITNHKEAEATLREALQKEKELGELKSRFLSIASHEFRTPLTTILGLTGLLRNRHQQMTSEQISQRLEKIQDQVNHIRLILDDVLLLSQSQQGIFAPAVGDLDVLCRTIIDELRCNPEYTVRLNYCYSGDLAELPLDQRLLRQVITNLIINALKYSPPEKQVYIALQQQDTALVLTVRDEGIGIPAADTAYLFRPFYRAGNVGKIPGTGLGLAIVKEAIERHGGTINVQSVVGAGTTFTVTLPVTEPRYLAINAV